MQAQVRIDGSIARDGNPLAQRVYLRVVDPTDPSDYRTPHLSRDNLDTRGSLYYRDDQGNIILHDPDGVLDLPGRQGGVDGRISAVLAVTTYAAGDNYQVEASFDRTFPCAPVGGPDICAKTAMITAWKRAYLEIDRMFRAGASITAPVAAGASVIPVDNSRAFHVGDAVLLIHAPALGSTAGWYSQQSVVTAIKHGRRHGAITIRDAVNAPYADAPVVLPSRTAVTDGVGIVNGSTAVYDASTSLISTLFDTAFVEYKPLLEGPGMAGTGPNVVPYVPFLLSIDSDVEPILAERWCETCVAGRAMDNHRHVIIASMLTTVPQTTGETNIDQQPVPPYSIVFRGRIDDAVANDPAYSQANPNVWAAETLVHELVHNWDVNPPTDTTGGHCNLRDWDNTDDCLMNRSNATSLANGVAKLHAWADPNCEYRRIRTQPDPIPQQHQH